MRQPQLGRKILELRKAKRLTQEELVEMKREVGPSALVGEQWEQWEL